MTDAPDLFERDAYFTTIERHFALRRGGPLMLSPRDWQRVERWQKKGIPLEAVLRGINAAFDQHDQLSNPGRRINSLSYCEQHVNAAWQEQRELAAAQGATSDDDPARDHLLGIASTCRSRASGTDADAYEIAASALEELAAECAGLDADEVDRRAGAIEDELRSQLSPDATDRPLPPLPPFSPWAV